MYPLLYPFFEKECQTIKKIKIKTLICQRFRKVCERMRNIYGAGGSYKNLIRPACERIVVSFSVSLLAIY
nr:MAG TPA: hypothetical protein [Caudoviricetes sp.]